MEGTSPGDSANQARGRFGDTLLRKSVWALDDEEVAALREAFRRSQESSDSRGYGHFASLHGFPEPGYCEHAPGQHHPPRGAACAAPPTAVW